MFVARFTNILCKIMYNQYSMSYYWGTDGSTDGRTDGRTDARTHGRTDGRTDGRTQIFE